jgi:hypothetical protein
MKYQFDIDPDGEVILLTVELDGKHTFKMVLDTGASRTTIDSTALYMVDYKARSTGGITEIETANGIIPVDLFEVKALSALGLTRKEFSIQVYDFLAHGILSDYDGLLGLDFFEDTTFCIDMKAHTIDIAS